MNYVTCKKCQRVHLGFSLPFLQNEHEQYGSPDPKELQVCTDCGNKYTDFRVSTEAEAKTAYKVAKDAELNFPGAIQHFDSSIIDMPEASDET